MCNVTTRAVVWVNTQILPLSLLFFFLQLDLLGHMALLRCLFIFSCHLAEWSHSCMPVWCTLPIQNVLLSVFCTHPNWLSIVDILPVHTDKMGIGSSYISWIINYVTSEKNDTSVTLVQVWCVSTILCLVFCGVATPNQMLLRYWGLMNWKCYLKCLTWLSFVFFKECSNLLYMHEFYFLWATDIYSPLVSMYSITRRTAHLLSSQFAGLDWYLYLSLKSIS